MASYGEKLLARYHLLPAKSSKNLTPLSRPFSILPANTEQATPSQIHEYQDRIGSLIYAAMALRVDMARAVSMLASFLQNPSQDHLREAEHLVRYLHATRSAEMIYQGSNPPIQAAADAAYVNEDARLSSYGYIFHLYRGVVSWKSSKLKSVVTSTTEAELMAASHAAKELISIERLLSQFSKDWIHQQATLLCDNQQTLRLLLGDNPQLTTKAKHVDIHHLWLRQEVQEGNIKIDWVPTKDMPADGLTKLLPKQEHAKFIRSCGLILQS